MPATRIYYVLVAVAAMLLLIGVAHQHHEVRSTIQKAWQRKSSSDEETSYSSPNTLSLVSNQPSFHEIALKYGTDKVVQHHYWFMYDKYFPAIRYDRVKMLEIGLGCNMNYGPGKSYYTWLEYFPNVDLYYMEVDEACADKWASETTGATIFAGDQADPTFLQKFIDESGGNFDVIIDDGGHSMKQQQTSLEYLWDIVKPGGFYFIEDLQTSHFTAFGGDPTSIDPNIPTMMKFIYQLIDDKITPDGINHPKISVDVRGIECQREICVLIKKERGTL